MKTAIIQGKPSLPFKWDNCGAHTLSSTPELSAFYAQRGWIVPVLLLLCSSQVLSFPERNPAVRKWINLYRSDQLPIIKYRLPPSWCWGLERSKHLKVPNMPVLCSRWNHNFARDCPVKPAHSYKGSALTGLWPSGHRTRLQNYSPKHLHLGNNRWGEGKGLSFQAQDCITNLKLKYLRFLNI